MAFLGPLELARVAGLRPALLVQVLPIMSAVEARTGKTVYVPEYGGTRTPEVQAMLLADRAAQGATYPVAPVERARHTKGAAVDFHITGGTDADYRVLADEAQRRGLVAGYYFRNSDPYHVELDEPWDVAVAKWDDLQKKKGCCCSGSRPSTSSGDRA